MDEVYLCLLSIALVVVWIAGVVVATGFWSTAAAICIPPYAWYLLIERVMQVLGLIVT